MIPGSESILGIRLAIGGCCITGGEKGGSGGGEGDTSAVELATRREKRIRSKNKPACR